MLLQLAGRVESRHSAQFEAVIVGAALIDIQRQLGMLRLGVSSECRGLVGFAIRCAPWAELCQTAGQRIWRHFEGPDDRLVTIEET